MFSITTMASSTTKPSGAEDTGLLAEDTLGTAFGALSL